MLSRRSFCGFLAALGPSLGLGRLFGQRSPDAKPEPLTQSLGGSCTVGAVRLDYQQEIERLYQPGDPGVYLRATGRYWLTLSLPYHLPMKFPMHDPRGFAMAKAVCEQAAKEHSALAQVLEQWTLFDKPPQEFWGKPGKWIYAAPSKCGAIGELALM